MDIPSSISFVMYSLSKNFISDGAKLEVHQDFSSLEYNLCISLSSKCVFCAAIVLLVVDFFVSYPLKRKLLRIPFLFFFLSFLYRIVGNLLLYFSKALKLMRSGFLLNLSVFPQRSLHLSDLLKSTQLLMSV